MVEKVVEDVRGKRSRLIEEEWKKGRVVLIQNENGNIMIYLFYLHNGEELR